MQDGYGRITNPALNAANVGSVQAASECETFLGKSALFPDPLNVPPDAPPNIHAPREQER